MKTREAMQALLDGKKIRLTYFLPGIYYQMNDLGEVVAQDGSTRDLFGKPIDDVATWVEYVAPNPHPKGTFAWAREEANRGNEVRRADWPRHCKMRLEAVFTLEDFDATDWTVVE